MFIENRQRRGYHALELVTGTANTWLAGMQPRVRDMKLNRRCPIAAQEHDLGTRQ